ncbi:hypothetical protein EBBID32_43610 [Sphingobium indicum BiD32]|uniref:Uncharacterized protein n=1 Tax=Sphingobium indicum BiD32 TaxID=1301087 RepID=N1MS01_9SPHN|nr:hypothetical protein EBBID32_43610 [Sphingobium indicum BiD32]
MAELFALFCKLRKRSERKAGQVYPIITLQESDIGSTQIVSYPTASRLKFLQ